MAAISATPAWSQSTSVPVTPPTAIPWDIAAQARMNEGRFEDALAVIAARLAVRPSDPDARFLEGMTHLARKDHRRAIASFRAILVDHPDAVRVRLELGRAFFLDRDYGNAQRQFRFALAGNPPAPVISNIRRYLHAIRESKSLSYSVTVSLAPDSNINTGSSAREVTLFGLPFDLSDDSRERSGVGVAIDTSGEWAPRIASGTRLRLGLSAQRRDYPKADFDDTILAAYAGPRLVHANWDISLLGTAYQRWYGPRRYSRATGVRAEIGHDLSPRVALSASVSAMHVAYRQARAMDGPLTSLASGLSYALTPSSALILKAGISRQSARVPAFSSWSRFAAIGYYRDLPLGFTLYAEPSLSSSRYDRAMLGFGETRWDRGRTLLVTLLNRRIILSRFTPRVSWTRVRQSSTIPLYAFSKNRLEVGVTTQF
jgi:tetratricopeptide (TPR) repeat protein